MQFYNFWHTVNMDNMDRSFMYFAYFSFSLSFCKIFAIQPQNWILNSISHKAIFLKSQFSWGSNKKMLSALFMFEACRFSHKNLPQTRGKGWHETQKVNAFKYINHYGVCIMWLVQIVVFNTPIHTCLYIEARRGHNISSTFQYNAKQFINTYGLQHYHTVE